MIEVIMDNKNSTNKPITSEINSNTTNDADDKGLDDTFVIINSEDLGNQGFTDRSLLNSRLSIVESEKRQLASNVELLRKQLNQQTACLSIVQQRNKQLEKTLAKVTELKDDYEQELDDINNSFKRAHEECQKELEDFQANKLDYSQFVVGPLPVAPDFSDDDEELSSLPPESPREVDSMDANLSNASETEPTSLVANTSLNLSHDNGNKTIDRG